MTHFEAYHWEDHVPRAGSWKFNLAAGLLALGLIYAALPDASGDAPAVAAAAVPASGASDREMAIPNGPAIQPVKSWWAYCPRATTDYADS
jgi:hypothetical protein